MKTAEEKAKEWVHRNVVLAEHCGIEYDELVCKLALLLKEQDRDTRHACAEAVNRVALDNKVASACHSAVMNTHAV